MSVSKINKYLNDPWTFQRSAGISKIGVIYKKSVGLSEINGQFKDQHLFQRSMGISKIMGFSKINRYFKDQWALQDQ